MKKRTIAILLTVMMALTSITGCGAKAEDAEQQAMEKTDEAENSDEVVDLNEISKGSGAELIEKAGNEVADEVSSDVLDELSALGDVTVDKDQSDITITVPKDFAGEATKEDIEKTVKDKGYKSGTLNEDGSVTFVMSKEQHKELVDTIGDSIDENLASMVGSNEYPNITDIKANEDFTSFTVTTKNEELDFSESFSVMAFYMYGGMYAIFAGETVDNIHVDFINEASGAIIKSVDSKDM